MTTVLWDYASKGSTMTISNNGLTANSTNYNGNVRTTIGRNTGKWYCEIKIEALDNIVIGVVTSSVPMTSQFNSNPNSLTYYPSGYIYPTGKPYGAGFTVGDVISILIDADKRILKFGKNGLIQSDINIASIVGDLYVAVGSTSSGGGFTVTANFGATPFKYEIPKGYYSFDESQFGAVSNTLIKYNDKIASLVNINNSGKDAVPTMKSSVNGNVSISASSIFSSSYPAWYAFSDDAVESSNTAWVSNNYDKIGAWIQVDFNEFITISSYSLTARAFAYADTTTPIGWKLQGSNDGLNFDDLDVRKSQQKFSSGEKRVFTNNTKIGKYRYYRIQCTEIADGTISYINYGEIELYKENESYIKYIESCTEQDFINHGMKNTNDTNINEIYRKRKYIKSTGSNFNSGKVFEHKIDLNKNNINVVTIQ